MNSNTILAILSSMCLSTAVLAAPDCTKEPKDKWKDQKEFEKSLKDEGYKIKKFKVSGNCYEIYGWNKEGKKVEIYFNPVTSAIVKQEVEGK